MRRDALVALGIFDDRLLGIGIAQELGFDPLEARFQRRVGRLVPGGIGSQLLLERLDALGRQRVVAVEAVGGIDREPVFLVLELAEEIEQALAADPRFAEEARGGRVGGRFLGAGEGEKFAECRALAAARIPMPASGAPAAIAAAPRSATGC